MSATPCTTRRRSGAACRTQRSGRSCEPLTQNRIAADWGIPKQTLNSAVAAMVKKGLLALCPGKGAHSGKIVTLTAEGRALAERTVVPVIAAEEKAIRAFGLASAEEMHRLAQRHLECLQREFETISAFP